MIQRKALRCCHPCYDTTVTDVTSDATVTGVIADATVTDVIADAIGLIDSTQTREEILRVSMAQNRVDASVNFTAITAELEGFTGSDIKEVRHPSNDRSLLGR